MNDTLRLYFMSHIRACIARDPEGLSDEELVGLATLMPKPNVMYSDWLERTGFADEEQPTRKFSDLTDDEIGAINDAAIHSSDLARKQADANRDAKQ